MNEFITAKDLVRVSEVRTADQLKCLANIEVLSCDLKLVKLSAVNCHLT